ncbi:MAG: SCO6880 family protein [Acidimicrobiales bacterium]
MSTGESKPRTYRFGARDRSGWLLGLQGAQCLALACGIVGGGSILNRGAPLPVAALPLLAGVGFAFARWQGEPVHAAAPVIASWLFAQATHRTSWFAAPPRFRHPSRQPARPQPDLPPTLHGLEIAGFEPWATVGGSHSEIGMILDRRDGSLTGVLRVCSREFALCERTDQERLLDLWGDALSTFCRERGPVGRIRWIEWSAPARLDDHFDHLAAAVCPAPNVAAVASYRDLLNVMANQTTHHEVLVAITLERKRLRLHRTSKQHAEAELEDGLRDELRLFTTRLETAGLVVDAPLTAPQLAKAWRERLDPFAIARPASRRRRSLVELSGTISVANAGPLSIDAALTHVRVDGAFHVAYSIAEWPRLDVPPGWMEPLMLHAGGIRTISVLYEPVAPSRARREIDKQTVKLASDEEQRSRSGFRIGARHRRVEADVLEREAELVGGFGEFEYTGFVIVTASDLDSLQRSCGEYEQAAAQSGLELRRLDGRHDLALALMLPVGRGLATKRFA